MGTKQKIDIVDNTDQIKVVDTDAVQEEKAEKKKAKTEARRSKKYVSARSIVDKTKLYDAFAAVELVKKLSYSKFDGTISADILVRDLGTQVDVAFPHTTGKVLRVAIATDEVLKEIEAGTINFDILVSAPAMVPKLAKFARTLGPRGLMPNPKNGTITPNPEQKKKELESGKTAIKTEKKQPVMHITLGKASMETKALVENVSALIEALGTKAVRLSLTSSMSPSVKVKIN
jgi:large subunit ribosomal protein L1